MKTITLTALFLTLAITGCQKQPEDKAKTFKVDPVASEQFDKSDKKIAKFLSQLEDPNTPPDVRKQILCVDYPTEYKENYIPALLKISPNYSKIKLQSDLNYVLNYYKVTLKIKC